MLPLIALADRSLVQIIEPSPLVLPEATSLISLAEFEMRWHYSQHFLAECMGERVIEDMRSVAYSRRQHVILDSQLVDEKRHVARMAKGVNILGLIPEASPYAQGYARLVEEQDTFCEKILTFQILTEAVSSAYCQWRLETYRHDYLNEVDAEIKTDEDRHLAMGRSLLALCDPDEVQKVLNPNRIRELTRIMNGICDGAIHQAMPETAARDLRLDEEQTESLHRRTSKLDITIARSIIRETKTVMRQIRDAKLTQTANSSGRE